MPDNADMNADTAADTAASTGITVNAGIEANAGVQALNSAIAKLPITGEDLIAGAPVAGTLELGEIAGAEVGLWELTAGTVRDTEADEFFVVIAGAGRVTFLDTGNTIDLAPGVVVRLAEGTRTEWTITETLRKVYIG